MNEMNIELYSTLCHVEANTSQVCKSLPQRHTHKGSYYRMEFDIILSFGLTELTAQISWMEDVSYLIDSCGTFLIQPEQSG